MHCKRLVHTCDISISINIRKNSVNRSNISISISTRKRKFFLFLMLMLMSRNRKCEPDNISISINITKQQYLMSAEIQTKIVPNPALIISFKMASLLTTQLPEIKFSVHQSHFKHKIVIISFLFSLREVFSCPTGPLSFFRLSLFPPSMSTEQ